MGAGEKWDSLFSATAVTAVVRGWHDKTEELKTGPEELLESQGLVESGTTSNPVVYSTM